MRSKELVAFIKAREEHRRFGETGKWPKGGGPDPIIAKYRFCNVIRADDRVTKFIFQWAEQRKGWMANKDLWFAFAVARLFNLPSTLEAITPHVLPFRPMGMRSALVKRKAVGNVFNAAYIVSTNGVSMDKIDYVVDRVLAPMWQNRAALRPKPGDTLDAIHQRFITAFGFSSFMAAQVVADLKYFPPYYARDLDLPRAAGAGGADDWWTFAASGPGSRRGLNRVLDRPADAPWREAAWRVTLTDLHKAILPLLPFTIGSRLTTQDLQNCLCEADKWWRAKEGGRPKQLYTPFEEK